jgi:hypothetical protein
MCIRINSIMSYDVHWMYTNMYKKITLKMVITYFKHGKKCNIKIIRYLFYRYLLDI